MKIQNPKKVPFNLANIEKIKAAMFKQVKIIEKARPGSTNYSEALQTIDAIEAALSILVIGHAGLSFFKSLEALEIQNNEKLI
jgi:hypothetical protein